MYIHILISLWPKYSSQDPLSCNETVLNKSDRDLLSMFRAYFAGSGENLQASTFYPNYFEYFMNTEGARRYELKP